MDTLKTQFVKYIHQSLESTSNGQAAQTKARRDIEDMVNEILTETFLSEDIATAFDDVDDLEVAVSNPPNGRIALVMVALKDIGNKNVLI